jgi:DNA polymerase III epsilon subunit-like protein
MTQTVLFFDTETTGLPKSNKAPVEDLDNWPRMVQLAWAVGSDKDVSAGTYNYIIKPDGYTIPDVVAKIHGITTERAMAEGVPIEGVLEEFRDAIGGVDLIAAHNMDFDEKIAGSEFLRAQFFNHLEDRPRVCTMRCSMTLCRIPQKNGRGLKWPKLAELHQFLFGCGFDGAHDARNDVAAGVRCYWELCARGVL